MNEIEILKVIGNHPNVVKLIEFYEEEG